MARRREVGVELPPDVHTVTSKGRTYFYHQVGRNTAAAGLRTSLGSDPARVWERWREASRQPAAPEPAADSFAALVAAYRASPEWRALQPATHRDYGFYLDRMGAAWGALPARAITPAGALAMRDALAETPVQANHMLSVGRALFKWGVPRNFAPANPFRELANLKTTDDGHRPWWDWALEFVAHESPEDIARFVFLALHSGQRESDVVRIGPAAREGRGLWVRPQKTRRKRRALFVPLTLQACAELDRWAQTPMIFRGGRWGRETRVEPGETYVLSPAGNPYTEAGLRSRWNRWLDTPAGRELVTRWTAAERAVRERDGEDVPEDAEFRPALHGLRSTAVCHRRLAGYKDEQIANDIGMSAPIVRRYSRFIDQREAAETNIVALDRVDRRKANVI